MIVPQILFSDFCKVPKERVEEYGAFDISLLSDLPLFIDPFLLFNSTDEKYQQLHDRIINYLKFLKDKSLREEADKGLIEALYTFREVKQTWLGYSVKGNRGRALGTGFANSLNKNFHILFDYGNERITKGTHLEKLCLIKSGVGRDNISDFTTNLIKEFLLDYTQDFARKYLDATVCKNFNVPKVRFNPTTETWEPAWFYLPTYLGDFVLLTPRNILTKDETWINMPDLVNDFEFIVNALPNESLRSQVNNYLRKVLTPKPTSKERREAVKKTVQQFPELIDYFIKRKEQTGDRAVKISESKVGYSRLLFLNKTVELAKLLSENSQFYKIFPSTLEETIDRAKYLKYIIENCDGYKIFYVNGYPIRREKDLQILYKLVWYGTPSDLSPEINAGRGPADFKLSRGALDKTMAELKLASNSKLEGNLRKQQEIHKKANMATWGVKIIIYFTEKELVKTKSILKRVGLETDEKVILIDARKDNKPSASKV